MNRLINKIKGLDYPEHLPLITILAVAILLHFTGGGGTEVSGDSALYMSYLLSVFEDGDIELGDDYLEIDPKIEFQQKNHLRKTDKGFTIATFPPGAAILWSPFFLTAKGYYALTGEQDRQQILEGYKQACHFGTTVYSIAGLVLLFFLLKRQFSPWVSAFASLGSFLLTPVLGYAYYLRVDSHGVGYFAISLFLWYCVKSGKERSLKQWGILGAIAGLVFMIRWTDMIVGVWLLVEQLPLLWASIREKKLPTKKLLAFLLFGLVFLVTITPQIIVHQTIFGFGKGPMNYGANFVKWDRPEVLNLLFSTRNGLFSWHPMVLAGIIGLFLLLWKKRAWALPAIISLLLATYINSVIGDWWAGHAFGMRRFCSYMPFIGLGFAGLLSACKKRWYQIGIGALMIFFAAWNIEILRAYIEEEIPHLLTPDSSNPLKGEGNWVNQFGRPLSWPAEIISSLILPGVPPREAEWLTSWQLMFCESNLRGHVKAGYPSFQQGFGSVEKDKIGEYRRQEDTGKVYLYRLAANGAKYITIDAEIFESKLKANQTPVLRLILNGKVIGLMFLPVDKKHNMNTFVRVPIQFWKYGINCLEIELFQGNKNLEKIPLSRLLKRKDNKRLKKAEASYKLRVRSVDFQLDPYIDIESKKSGRSKKPKNRKIK